MIDFSTKAQTLELLKKHIKTAHILPQVRFSTSDWKKDPETILKKIEKSGWTSIPVIVRSSGSTEDRKKASRAGQFVSIPHVLGRERIKAAIDEVARSFGRINKRDLIFIQKQLQNVAVSGVAFSKDQNTGAPYIVINFDDQSSTTDSVTQGRSNLLKTFISAKSLDIRPPKKLSQLFPLIRELEKLLGTDALDIEFAIDKKKNLILFQVRPLAGVPKVHFKAVATAQKNTLQSIAQKVRRLGGRHPYLYGDRSLFGVMPDWNPAEITGIRPRPLTLSLYKELITDSIWAYQRDNYGYKNLRSFPLLVNFGGCPYIDVRVSFNSFLPADLNDSLSDRLINHYLDKLQSNPALHDKVEFDIVYSCYTLDIHERLRSLTVAGFSAEDRRQLTLSLKSLTKKIINPKNGIWRNDLRKVQNLDSRREAILNSHLDDVSRVYWLLEDCKRFGTLPFAGLARAAFIAVQNLKALVSLDLISPEEHQAFMRSLNSISSQISDDLGRLNPEDFLSLYGHLRPGTYDILAPRYADNMSLYFDLSHKSNRRKTDPFRLPDKKRKKITRFLEKHGLQLNADAFFDFTRGAIESREYGKFLFTKSVSDTLDLLKKMGRENGFSTDDMSYVDIQSFHRLYSSSVDQRQVFSQSIEEGKERYEVTRSLILPPLISKASDVFAFELLPGKPNFITNMKARGQVMRPTDDRKKLARSILLIPSADPGYDWIFSWGIAGFITAYGGANSHMAIRAAEQGIPAVIGAGENLFQKWSSAKHLEIDCLNQNVRIVG